MKVTSAHLAVAMLALTAVGAVAAMQVNLPAQFVMVGKPAESVGAEALWAGSAVNASWAPVAGLVAGLVLLRGDGFARSFGHGLLAAMGAIMTVGVLGEYAAGPAFTGVGEAVFLAFAMTRLTLSLGLVVTGMRGLLGSSGPIPVSRGPRFEGWE